MNVGMGSCRKSIDGLGPPYRMRSWSLSRCLMSMEAEAFLVVGWRKCARSGNPT
jgi:hypothetical protein